MKSCSSEFIEKISTWKKIKRFSKRNKIPMIMVAVNVIIIISGLILGLKYLNNSDNVIQNLANAGSVSLATSLSNKMKGDLLLIQENLENLALEVNQTDIELQDIPEYIKAKESLNYDVAIINSSTYEGYLSDFGEVTLENNEQTQNLVNEICVGQFDTNIVHVSKEFWDNNNEQYEIAVGVPVKIQYKKYALLAFISVADLVGDENVSNMLYSSNHSVIINEAGELIYGSLKDIVSIGANTKISHFSDISKFNPISGSESQEGTEAKINLEIHENIFNYAGEADSNLEILIDKIKAKENGFFVAKESDKEQHLYTYFFMTDFNNWVYINRIDNQLLSSGSDAIKIALEVIILLTSFFGINMFMIFWQNLRLKRTLVILEDNNIALEKANKAQQTFISSMSHEIRTPINAVLGMDEMIIRESTEDEIKKYAYDIKSAGKSLLSIVNDILDFTKIQSGKMDIITQDYELASLVNDLINLVDIRMKNKNLDFVINMNPDIPHLMIGDDIRIKQIIQNILTNAAKYTEKGSVTFTLDYKKKDDSSVILKVSVKDTGIGIKPEEMDKLTKPFERLDEKKTRTIEGTGLGMSIVTNLLHAMGSSLEVESEYGFGSTFSFELVQQVVDWKGVGPLDRSFRDTREEKSDEIILRAKRAKILVVDDTTMNLTVVHGLLKRTGVQVDTAESGFEALDLCKNKKYDVILLDHRMPEMDGVETLEHLKKEEGMNQDTPTIALTANAISGAREEYLGYGFEDFLSKPVSGNKLERMILKYLPKDLLDSEEDLEIDDNAGIKACGSKEVIDQVRKEFVQTGEKNRKELATYLENGDIKNYTIKVHAIKSTARLVGATTLSEEALYLENCGNEGKEQEILEKTSDFLEHHKKVCLILKKNLPDTEKDLEIIKESELKEALCAILEFNQAFDFDGVDSVIETLDKYAMPDYFKEKYEELKTAIYDVNQETISQIINEVLNNGK